MNHYWPIFQKEVKSDLAHSWMVLLSLCQVSLLNRRSWGTQAKRTGIWCGRSQDRGFRVTLGLINSHYIILFYTCPYHEELRACHLFPSDPRHSFKWAVDSLWWWTAPSWWHFKWALRVPTKDLPCVQLGHSLPRSTPGDMNKPFLRAQFNSSASGRFFISPGSPDSSLWSYKGLYTSTLSTWDYEMWGDRLHEGAVMSGLWEYLPFHLALDSGF